MMKDRLIKSIIELSSDLNLPANEIGFRTRIVDILDNNEMEYDENIPDWLVYFFEAIVSKQSVQKTKFVFKQPGKGDFVNFIAELADILERKFIFYGEGIYLPFKEIGMEGLILFEGDVYEVRKLQN